MQRVPAFEQGILVIPITANVNEKGWQTFGVLQ